MSVFVNSLQQHSASGMENAELDRAEIIRRRKPIL